MKRIPTIIAASLICLTSLARQSETGYMKNIYNIYGFFETDFVRWEKFSIGIKGHRGSSHVRTILSFARASQRRDIASNGNG